jgi:hypothetical protein
MIARCDGPEDCGDGETCETSGGEWHHAHCLAPAGLCSDDCSCTEPFWGGRACHSLADCPPCATSCAPSPLGFPLSTCQ